MSRYSLWNKPRSREDALSTRKHSVSRTWPGGTPSGTHFHLGRLAYLKDVKGPQQAQGPNQKRPSVKADRFAASVLEELQAAGFVELGDSGSGGPRDRVFAVVAAIDFATRVRALSRHHLLRGDLPSLLENYVRYCFYPAAADALDSVLRHAGLQEGLNLEETLRLYVVGHRWPGWVARSLKDPAAERIVELLRDANGPVEAPSSRRSCLESPPTSCKPHSVP